MLAQLTLLTESNSTGASLSGLSFCPRGVWPPCHPFLAHLRSASVRPLSPPTPAATVVSGREVRICTYSLFRFFLPNKVALGFLLILILLMLLFDPELDPLAGSGFRQIQSHGVICLLSCRNGELLRRGSAHGRAPCSRLGRGPRHEGEAWRSIGKN
jgi:hypothetical protein